MKMPPEIVALLADLATAAPGARVEQHIFPSGAVWLDVMIGDRWFVFSAGPTSGIGVSENIDDHTAFSPHDQYFKTLKEAAAHLLVLVRSATTSSSHQAA